MEETTKDMSNSDARAAISLFLSDMITANVQYNDYGLPILITPPTDLKYVDAFPSSAEAWGELIDEKIEESREAVKEYPELSERIVLLENLNLHLRQTMLEVS